MFKHPPTVDHLRAHTCEKIATNTFAAISFLVSTVMHLNYCQFPSKLDTYVFICIFIEILLSLPKTLMYVKAAI